MILYAYIYYDEAGEIYYIYRDIHKFGFMKPVKKVYCIGTLPEATVLYNNTNPDYKKYEKVHL